MAKTKQSIIRHANEFIEMASADIRAKLVEVMENTDLDADEIADALDIDEECRLLVRYEDGSTEALSSGEVSVRPLS
jgi:biotin-(acetyl-CoA carboxylase) ligase